MVWRAACWVAVGFAPFVAFTLLYNHRVSGSFTQFPITAKDPLDTFGFGARRLMPIGQIFDYTIGRAVRSVLHNMPHPPGFLRRRLGRCHRGRRWVVAPKAGPQHARAGRARSVVPGRILLLLGNLLSSRAAGLSGAIYYLPLYVPSCIFLATVLIAAWRHRRGLAVALCLVLAVATIPYLVSAIGPNHKISTAQEPWKDATRADPRPRSGHRRQLRPVSHAPEPVLGQHGRSRQPNPVRGGHAEPENLDLMAAHPDRTPYLESTSDPGFDDPVAYHDAPVPRVWLTQLQVLHGNAVTLRVRVTNPRDEPAVVVYLRIGRHVEQRTLAVDAHAGSTFETQWTLSPGGTPEVGAGGAVPLIKRRGAITIGMGTGATPGDALAGDQVQQLFFYRLDAGTGVIDVLYPGRAFIGERPKRRLELTAVDRLRNLDVQVTTNL